MSGVRSSSVTGRRNACRARFATIFRAHPLSLDSSAGELRRDAAAAPAEAVAVLSSGPDTGRAMDVGEADTPRPSAAGWQMKILLRLADWLMPVTVSGPRIC